MTQPTTGPTAAPQWLIVGGGLHGCLLALSLLRRDPNVRLTLVEPAPTLGGNHTWCFYEGDVAEPPPWLGSLVVCSWPGYEVRFKSHERRVQEPYHQISSERLHQVLSATLERAPNARWVQQAASSVQPGRVQLAGGTLLEAQQVVDARGPARAAGSGRAREAYQKFVGLELRVEPAGVPSIPTVMDACVKQQDGFRFEYLLPLGKDRVLVEDTYYSDSASLDEAALVQRSLAYAGQRGLVVRGVERQEQGVLPLPLRLPTLAAAGAPEGAGLLNIGYAGALFHPTTGYSLPWAVQTARRLTELSGPASEQKEEVETLRSRMTQALSSLRADLRKQQRYAVWLNRLLFEGFAPAQRHHVLERFYRLPEGIIRRFYALQLTPSDRMRIVVGWPPRGLSLGRLARGALGT